MLYYREISEENFNTHLREMVGVVTAGEGLVTFIGFSQAIWSARLVERGR